jgi:AcrR family transcriptional regulator
LRKRLIEAVITETVEFGHAGATIERIVGKAGASRASFVSQFADKKAAVEVAYQCIFGRYIDRLLQTCEVHPSWPLKVKVGIGVTLDMAAASPVDARFLIETMTGACGSPDSTLDSRGRLARLLAAGRTETPYGADLPGIVESALVGGIGAVISAQLRSGEAKQLPALAPQLVELTLTPYIGSEQAAVVARRTPLQSLDR